MTFALQWRSYCLSGNPLRGVSRKRRGCKGKTFAPQDTPEIDRLSGVVSADYQLLLGQLLVDNDADPAGADHHGLAETLQVTALWHGGPRFRDSGAYYHFSGEGG